MAPGDILSLKRTRVSCNDIPFMPQAREEPHALPDVTSLKEELPVAPRAKASGRAVTPNIPRALLELSREFRDHNSGRGF